LAKPIDYNEDCHAEHHQQIDQPQRQMITRVRKVQVFIFLLGRE